MEPEFITVAQAADRAGCTQQTIFRWIREGALVRYKTGTGRGKTWVKVTELDGVAAPTPAVESAHR